MQTPASCFHLKEQQLPSTEVPDYQSFTPHASSLPSCPWYLECGPCTSSIITAEDLFKMRTLGPTPGLLHLNQPLSAIPTGCNKHTFFEDPLLRRTMHQNHPRSEANANPRPRPGKVSGLGMCTF